MNADQIMDALGKVKESYIIESAPGKKKYRRKSRVRWIAAVVGIVIILTFFQTAPGALALEFVKEKITNFIETMFPPKDIIVIVEGEPEVLPHEAGGREPDVQTDGIVTPGFAIYYDTENYIMIEENDVTYIREREGYVAPSREEIRRSNGALLKGLTDEEIEKKIDELLARLEEYYTNLPACEMEIVYLPDIQPLNAAQSARDKAARVWKNLSQVKDCNEPTGYYFDVSAGEDGDSACEDAYFISDGQNGTFKITIRYFLDAIEGHAVRFRQMLRTFEVVTP